MVCYNPWDAQYLGYLVMDYSDEDYAAEAAREFSGKIYVPDDLEVIEL